MIIRTTLPAILLAGLLAACSPRRSMRTTMSPSRSRAPKSTATNMTAKTPTTRTEGQTNHEGDASRRTGGAHPALRLF